MRRTDKLRELLRDDEAVYITGYPNIFYYSGFRSPDAKLLISKGQAILITDSRYTIQAKQQAPEFEIYDIKDGLAGAFAKIDAQIIGYEEEQITAKALETAKNAAQNHSFVPMQDKISGVRSIKEDSEIKRIRAAEELGDAAFSHILDFIHEGAKEKDIAFEMEFFMRKNGASALSFETIAASGVRSAMPHGVASDKRLERGDLFTLDFGCVLDGYCSDMTRTVAIGEPGAKKREIYEVVKKAQQTALGAICTGSKLCDIDAAARNVIADAGYGQYFGHALGHSVGIEIHENPCFSPRAEGTVQNGHVITVEPGIYIEGLGGVRIEDLVAVHGDKCEILSHSPKELIIL